MSGQRKAFPVAAVAGLLFVVGVLAVFNKDIRIKYHRSRMRSAWAKVHELGPEDSRQGNYLEAYDRHKDALVELGYLERRKFLLQHIRAPSLESRRLWEELGVAFPENSHAAMSYEEPVQDYVLVWDCPENIPAWEEIIRAHDQPASQEIVADMESLRQFVGTWASDEGEVCFVISWESGGPGSIIVPSNGIWRTEIRNIRLEGRRLMFDQYFYTKARDDYRTPFDSSGEHPFSGVRCQIVLETDHNDPQRMTYSLKSIHTSEPIVENLHRTPAASGPQGSRAIGLPLIAGIG